MHRKTWARTRGSGPMLFDDDDPTAAARERASIVAPAQPSPAALRKRASKVTADGGPLHSFHSLLRDLATCTLNEMTTTLNGWAEPITGYSLAGSTASRLKAWAWIGVGVATNAKL